MDIMIDEPTTIRGYTPGGKGGWGHDSTPLHRLVRRTTRADYAACGDKFTGKISVKPCGRDGRPTKSETQKYGLCQKGCWPED